MNIIIGGSNTEIFTIREYILYKKQYILKDMELNDIEEEYQYVNNSYDKIFRKILCNKNEVANVINRVLKEQNNISADEIVKYNSSYVSDKLKNSEADIVYKLKNEDVFFLIEHQSKVDYSMPYRILKYEVDIIESVLLDKKYKNKQYRYPSVIPIVLYTGSKAWDAKLDLRNIQLKWNKYEGQELSRYNIIDVNILDDVELLEEKSFVSKMFLIEKSNTEKKLQENLNKILDKIVSENHLFNEEQIQFFETIIQLVLQRKSGKSKTDEAIYKLRKGVNKNMLAVLEMLDRENARIRNEGRIEGKLEDVKNMLKEKLPIDLICKITGVEKDEIKKIEKSMLN